MTFYPKVKDDKVLVSFQDTLVAAQPLDTFPIMHCRIRIPYSISVAAGDKGHRGTCPAQISIENISFVLLPMVGYSIDGWQPKCMDSRRDKDIKTIDAESESRLSRTPVPQMNDEWYPNDEVFSFLHLIEKRT
ncbi:hypothetical protein NQ318_012796 [Aromia moschata]|uniref:Uncharacterized protein n=1 Tax=Aromia moschata TaxID=1265417 RepID=A0AAV8YIH0_9CUCU|nr:hypothetical protein NQ318_012796 [Aromia moschata]